MPRAEDNDLESGQRYGLMEGERSISGQKRICFCFGQLVGKLNKWLIFFVTIFYPIIYFIGFYSGYTSNCSCNTTLT